MMKRVELAFRRAKELFCERLAVAILSHRSENRWDAFLTFEGRNAAKEEKQSFISLDAALAFVSEHPATDAETVVILDDIL